MPIVRKYMKLLPVHRLQDLLNNQRHEKPTSVIDCHATKFPNPPSFLTQYKIRKRKSFAKKYMSAISEVFQTFYKLANNSDRPSHPTQKQKKDGSHLTAIIRLHSLRNRTQGPSVRAAFWGHYDRWLLYNFWLRRGFPLQNWNIKYIFIVTSPSLPIVFTGV